MSDPFLEFRRSLPDAARQQLPLQPRLLEETAEGMLQRTDSLWLVIVPDEGEPELVNFADARELAVRVQQLINRGFFGNVYAFEGTRVLVSDPPASMLVFADGRCVPLEPPTDLLRVNPEGRLDPEHWEERLKLAEASTGKRGRRSRRERDDDDPDSPEYNDGRFDTEDDQLDDGAFDSGSEELEPGTAEDVPADPDDLP